LIINHEIDFRVFTEAGENIVKSEELLG